MKKRPQMGSFLLAFGQPADLIGDLIVGDLEVIAHF